MAKTSNPYGLSLFEYKGSNFSGTLATYPVNPAANSFYSANDATGYASATPTGIYTGDLVTFGPSSSAGALGTTWALPAQSNGYLSLANSILYGNTNKNYPRAILGVFQGVQYQPTQGQTVRSQYWSNTTINSNSPLIATVNDLADCIFQVQCNAALGQTTALAQSTIGDLFGFVNNGGGNPNNGQSALALDVASLNTITVNPYATNVVPAQCYPFRLIGLAPIQGNSWTDPYPDVLVMINNHIWKPGQPA